MPNGKDKINYVPTISGTWEFLNGFKDCYEYDSYNNKNDDEGKLNDDKLLGEDFWMPGYKQFWRGRRKETKKIRIILDEGVTVTHPKFNVYEFEISDFVGEPPPDEIYANPPVLRDMLKKDLDFGKGEGGGGNQGNKGKKVSGRSSSNYADTSRIKPWEFEGEDLNDEDITDLDKLDNWRFDWTGLTADEINELKKMISDFIVNSKEFKKIWDEIINILKSWETLHRKLTIGIGISIRDNNSQDASFTVPWPSGITNMRDSAILDLAPDFWSLTRYMRILTLIHELYLVWSILTRNDFGNQTIKINNVDVNLEELRAFQFANRVLKQLKYPPVRKYSGFRIENNRLVPYTIDIPEEFLYEGP